MKPNPFWLTAPEEPRIIAETASYLVVYKPPRMHTAPLKPEETATLLAWTAARFPDVLRVRGRKAIEGGLLHRLDYETQGLTLFARTDQAFNAFTAQQTENNIVKEYDAVSAAALSASLPGFPPYPDSPESTIESAFRPFGKGRKEVRPSPEGEPRYRTEICSVIEEDNNRYFRLRITRGFRHQIRCHLAWLKRPLINDTLYGGRCDGGFLALRASALAFADPESGKAREYCIEAY